MRRAFISSGSRICNRRLNPPQIEFAGPGVEAEGRWRSAELDEGEVAPVLQVVGPLDEKSAPRLSGPGIAPIVPGGAGEDWAGTGGGGGPGEKEKKEGEKEDKEAGHGI